MIQGSFLGRQPIVDRDQHVVGYELLYRESRAAGSACIEDVSRAALRVMAQTFASFGRDAVLGRADGFFNVDREVLLSDALEALPRDCVVLEILEDVEPTPDVIDRCRALGEAGFTMALDDWVPDDPRAPLLPHVDLVKVDLPAVPAGELRRLARGLRRADVQLLAEKVEEREEFETCHRLGFDRFQGYYFAKPIVLEGAELDATQATLLRLLQQISAGVDTDEIVDSLKQEPELGLSLLRLVNTAAHATRMQLETIEDAVRHLGLRPLARWVTILLYAQGASGSMRSPLLTAAAHRGRLMELIVGGETQGHPSRVERERAFLVGMLSLADALLGRPLDGLVCELQLADSVARALTHREGELGALLELTGAIERGEIDALAARLEDWNLDFAQLQEIEHRAYAWVHGLLAGTAL